MNHMMGKGVLKKSITKEFHNNYVRIFPRDIFITPLQIFHYLSSRTMTLSDTKLTIENTEHIRNKFDTSNILLNTLTHAF